MDKYENAIRNAESLDDLEFIIELASNDESISSREYCQVYGKAIDRAHDFTPYVNCGL